ncbi:MAG TPA: adenylyl-sulfate kinase [Nitrospirota bacterium]|nr:adenylyl-sulfate kinase [Nitrospirota bacterium]
MNEGFAIWLTGLPASGKTAVAEAIIRRVEELYEIKVQHLESDALRKVLTPEPSYSLTEREWFYDVLVFMGEMLTRNGTNVIIDATGNRKAHRDKARNATGKFLEVYIRCPLKTCMDRDPKGIYRLAQLGKTTTVPGIQDVYEEPVSPDLIIDSDKVSPGTGAEHVIAALKGKHWV